MSLENKITSILKSEGADFVHFVDISHLSSVQNNGYPNAILFGISLTPSYIQEVADTPDYVQARFNNNFDFDDDEFYLTELKTGRLADKMADYLKQEGYRAYSQSDENIISENAYDEEHKKTPLPHKTIAILSGIGWIGKHNLLVTKEYGSGLCLGTILTDAPLPIVHNNILVPKCGNCNICKDICEPKAIKGCTWSNTTEREEIIDVFKCTTCIKCLVHCPWTQAYVRRNK